MSLGLCLFSAINSFTSFSSALNNLICLLCQVPKNSQQTISITTHLTELEKETYWLRYSHFATKVIEGESRQSVFSDMYAVEGLFYRIAERCSVKGSSCEKILLKIAEKCHLVQCHY